MLDDFFKFFGIKESMEETNDLYKDFLKQYGGKQFGSGLFVVFRENDLEKWTQIISSTFEDFKGIFKVFGYDWLGRCFAIDLREDTKENIVMFEIGTNDVLEIPCAFREFLEKEIPLYTDACLAEKFFKEWSEFAKIKLQYGRCAGYKLPLFLGGADEKENLQDSDMEVYWDVITQIIKQL